MLAAAAAAAAATARSMTAWMSGMASRTCRGQPRPHPRPAGKAAAQAPSASPRRLGHSPTRSRQPESWSCQVRFGARLTSNTLVNQPGRGRPLGRTAAGPWAGPPPPLRPLHTGSPTRTRHPGLSESRVDSAEPADSCARAVAPCATGRRLAACQKDCVGYHPTLISESGLGRATAWSDWTSSSL